ncbi:hypothetical protein ANN_25453 [Periplaneta americana]|uniref:Uncharacterized protein n=1 Tax=Periplaneta americana TaxID=6978 RepID=A0ABQ8S202_PERAM|nr:hypothetical protein ANN_25453 [Periplaneta americana]
MKEDIGKEELTGSRHIHVEAELLHLFRIPRIPSVSFQGSPGLWQLCNVRTRGQDGIVRDVCVGSHKSTVCVRSNTNCCSNGGVAVPNYGAEMVENGERKKCELDYKTIKRLHANLIRTGSVTQQKGAGLPKTVITEEAKAALPEKC